jgi:hypothetical protein
MQSVRSIQLVMEHVAYVYGKLFADRLLSTVSSTKEHHHTQMLRRCRYGMQGVSGSELVLHCVT